MKTGVLFLMLTLACVRRSSAEVGLRVILPFPDGDKAGYVNELGEWVIAPRFEYVCRFREGRALVSTLDPGRVYSRSRFIDPSGKAICPRAFDSAFEFTEGLAAVSASNAWYFVDMTGDYVIGPVDAQNLRGFSEGLACFWKGHAFGFLNKAGDVAIPADFWWARDFHEGVAAACWDMRKQPPEYATAISRSIPRDVSESEAYQWGYISKRGVFVIYPQFDDAAGFSEGLAAVTVNGKVGFIDHGGSVAVSNAFVQASRFSCGRAAATMDGAHWGYIDREGTFVIEPRFEVADDFCEDGLARIAMGEDVLYGYVGLDGRLVLPAEYDGATTFVSGYAEVWRDTTTGKVWNVVNTSGRAVSTRVIAP